MNVQAKQIEELIIVNDISNNGKIMKTFNISSSPLFNSKKLNIYADECKIEKNFSKISCLYDEYFKTKQEDNNNAIKSNDILTKELFLTNSVSTENFP